MRKYLIFTFIVAAVLSLTFFVSAGRANTFTDDFATGINNFYWTPAVTSPSTIAWDSANQRVLMTQGAGGSIAGASLGFNYKAKGDFEIRVDYALVNWNIPGLTYNNERSGITTDFGAVERISDSRFGGERYLTDYNSSGGGIVSQATTDLSGTLRFVRASGVLTGYYLSGQNWVPIATDPGNWTADTGLGLSIWPWDPVPGVQVAFDNFYLTSEAVIPTQGVPEPTTMLLFGFGLIGLAGIRRFRK